MWAPDSWQVMGSAVPGSAHGFAAKEKGHRRQHWIAASCVLTVLFGVEREGSGGTLN